MDTNVVERAIRRHTLTKKLDSAARAGDNDQAIAPDHDRGQRRL